MSFYVLSSIWFFVFVICDGGDGYHSLLGVAESMVQGEFLGEG